MAQCPCRLPSGGVGHEPAGVPVSPCHGYVAPAGTPKRIVDLLNAEINRAMTMPDVREKLEAIGLTVVAESAGQFAQVLKSDYEK